MLAHLLKYDSAQGRYALGDTVTAGENSITVDGKEIPHFLHRRKFEEAECGWYYSQTLKSVQVKYLNPKKDHQVVVSFEQFDLIGM